MSKKDQLADYVDVDYQLKQSTIMMVDDESINTDIIQIHLENAGYGNFITTDKSEQAISLLRTKRPDVLLLDLQMPRVTGFDILQEMRADNELRHIPVIILTSSTDAPTKLNALELGATDFLSKPADPSELVLRIKNTLSVKSYQDQLAYYDSVTGLPNRRLFLDRLNWVIRNAKREKKITAILHISFDQLKHFNDTLGPKTGKALVQQIAERLQDCAHSTGNVKNIMQHSFANTSAHLGGGEFSVLLPRINNTENAAIFSQRILMAFHDPFIVQGNDIILHTNIGIATFPNDGNKVEELLAFASSASNYSRQKGQNNYLFYSKDINEKSLKQMKLLSHLHKAIDNKEMQLYYQPKIDTRSGKVIGSEALIRWISPEFGFMPPMDFIPLAEESGLIIQIGKWVINEACRQTREWQKLGLKDLTISVNVSGVQLLKQELPLVVKQALEKSGLDPRHLVLEMTESVVMRNPEQTIKILQQLKKLQLSLSIDDFGTGYSSLSYLKRFPLDELKIDRSFITDVENDDDSKAIVTAVHAMAHSLGLEIVAEGVENKSQLVFLKTLKCDQIQGYYFSKPLPKDEFAAFAMKRNAQK